MFSRIRSVIVAVAALCLVATIGGIAQAPAAEPVARLAVFPLENLSGRSIPAGEIRRFVIDRLAAQGTAVLDDVALEAFMARHRVRYAAGIETEVAEALRREAGVDAALFTSVELSSEAVPPKFAVIGRLVSITGVPTVIWADAAGLAGDDAPGFFALGLVNDYRRLQMKALEQLSRSLLAFLQGEATSGMKRASKFRPKSAYRAIALDSGRQYSVAVLPFFNLSDRRNAGDILSLLFIRHLSSLQGFRVVDPGVTRRFLLDTRVIMDGGVSIADAEAVAALIDADFVLGGRVIHYEDYEGAGQPPNVEFSTVIIARANRKVVWSSHSYNGGRDGVGLFERGTSRTAHAMATQMVRLTAEMIVGRRQARTDEP